MKKQTAPCTAPMRTPVFQKDAVVSDVVCRLSYSCRESELDNEVSPLPGHPHLILAGSPQHFITCG